MDLLSLTGIKPTFIVRNETAIPSLSGDPKATRLRWTKLRRMLATHSVLATLEVLRSNKTKKNKKNFASHVESRD